MQPQPKTVSAVADLAAEGRLKRLCMAVSGMGSPLFDPELEMIAIRFRDHTHWQSS